MRDPLNAFEFLTALPLRRVPLLRHILEQPDPPRMTRTLAWFPFVGGVLGLVIALIDRALSGFLTRDLRTIGVLAALALLTGLLHLDGFMDSCDGLLGMRPVARRLEIMRDSRVGSYAVVGIILLLGTQYLALVHLPPLERFLAIILGPLFGRWAMVVALVSRPYARTAGAGSGFQGTRRQLCTSSISLVIGLVVLAWLPQFPLVSLHWLIALLCLWGIAAIAALAWIAWASQRLGGGLTGDTYGAANELVTLAVWLMLPAVLDWATRISGLLARR